MVGSCDATQVLMGVSTWLNVSIWYARNRNAVRPGAATEAYTTTWVPLK
jgi:hypothetical protein